MSVSTGHRAEERAMANPALLGPIPAVGGRLTIPSSVASSITLWRVDHAGDNSRAGAELLTDEDWRELSRTRGLARERAFRVRALLRQALSAAVGEEVDAGAWRFVRNTYGKLMVVDGLPRIDFSISHSMTTTCIAVATSGRVGLDIAHAIVPNWHTVAEQFLSRADRNMINRRDTVGGEREFLRLWTAKEAFAKLIGVGLAVSAPEMDCGVGTRLASWVAESPSGDLSISLAFDEPTAKQRIGWPGG